MRVGIDLVHIAEVAATLDRFGARYLERFFTSSEVAYCRQDAAQTAARLATRFAAKEAVRKVLRIDDQAVPWREIEVVRAPTGHCEILLHSAAAALASTEGVGGFCVSLSHEGEYATAVVVAEEHPGSPNR